MSLPQILDVGISKFHGEGNFDLTTDLKVNNESSSHDAASLIASLEGELAELRQALKMKK